MTRAEALRRIAELHTVWSLEHGDDVPYIAADSNPHSGETTDLSVWQADRSAPAQIDDPLNEAIKAILAQIDDAPPTAQASYRLLNIAPEDIDLRQVQRDWERRLDDLIRIWGDITARQRDQIVDQVRAAITHNDLAALAAVTVTTAEATEALTEAMTEMALSAAQQYVQEAALQDVRLDPVASDSATFAALAGVTTALLAEGLTNSAGREALRRWSPTTTGDDVSQAVKEHLESLSDQFVRDQLGASLSSAQMTGRVNTMLSGPTAALYASEMLDKRTCLAPTALVTTRRGEIRADEVRLDDELLTHGGRWVRPSHLMVTGVDEDLVALGLDGERELLVTWDHPVLAVELGEFVWRQAGNLAVGCLVLGQASLQGERELRVPNLAFGQTPDGVPAFDQCGGLAAVNVRAQRVPVASISLDHEVIPDEEVNDPSTDLGLRQQTQPERLQAQSHRTLDARLVLAGHVAALAAVAPLLQVGWDDAELDATVPAGDQYGRPSADLAAVGAVRGVTVAEHRAASPTDLLTPASVEGAGTRAVVVPLGIADRNAEFGAAVRAYLRGPVAPSPDLRPQIGVSELAGNAAIDGARLGAAGDLSSARLAEPRCGAGSPALDGRMPLAPLSPGSNGESAVNTHPVHGLSLVKVTTVERRAHRGLVFDFAVPGDGTFWAEGVLVHNCEPCARVNGKWIGNTDDPDITAKVEAVYPNGNYRDCEGGVRCRGQVVAVHRR